jgi:hypothetical protein
MSGKTQARRYDGAKTYSKAEMAGFYKVTSTTFSQWIEAEPIMKLLLENGYSHTQKILKPIQVKIIVEHLGEP